MGVFLILAFVGLGKPVLTLGEELAGHEPPAKFYAAVPDLLLYRPILAFGALLPSTGFVASLPITYPSNHDLKAADSLLHRPWSYIADRPLGVFTPNKNIPARIDQGISSQYQEYFVRVGADRSPDQR